MGMVGSTLYTAQQPDVGYIDGTLLGVSSWEDRISLRIWVFFVLVGGGSQSFYFE